MTDAALFAERERVVFALSDAIATGTREYINTCDRFGGFMLAVDWLHLRAQKVRHEIRQRRSGQ